MTNRQHRIKDLFNSVADLGSQAEQAAYLNEHCSDDERLRAEVLNLVAHADRAGDFMEIAIDTKFLIDDELRLEDQSLIDQQIGPYRIREKLGAGGMGIVYLAEQKSPVRRKVALKVVKPGMDTQEVLSRFDAERQALAMMDHPNVARVLDAGQTRAGRSYFVMEVVQGLPITNYCDEQRLSNRDRLALMAKVCKAVQHAHRKGIIHRDLKPSNILVAQIDGEPVPKVIDFGVAKAIGQTLSDQSVYTQFSQMIGTPLYMSPEQAEMGVIDVDTRSDVYSLGVILYELLTGNTPFDKTALRQAGFDEMRRIILEQEPPRPSSRVSTLAAHVGTTVADRRRSVPRRLGASLKGELDWIVLKSLEKDRRRRYDSPSELAADIERYLQNKPVAAKPPSAWYQMKKSAVRHQIALLTGTAVLLALVTGTAIAVSQAIKANASQRDAVASLDLAQQNAEQAEAIANFVLDGIIEAASPESTRGAKPTLHQFLSQAEINIEKEFGNQPRLEAWVRTQFSRAFEGLGDYRVSERNALEAYQTAVDSLGGEEETTLDAADRLALIWSLQGKVESISLAEEILADRQRLLGATHVKTLWSMNTLGRVLSEARRFSEAETYFQSTLERSLEVGADEIISLASANLAAALMSQGKLDSAEASLRRVWERHLDKLGKDHPDTLDVMQNLARTRGDAGQYAEAKALYDELLPMRRKVQGADHPNTLKGILNSAGLSFRMGDLATARKLYEELLPLYRQKLDDHPETAGVLRNLSMISSQTGKLEEAIDYATEAFEIFDRRLGCTSPETLSALNVLAIVQKNRGDWQQAEAKYRDVIERREQIRGEQPENYSNIVSLGGTYCNLGNLLMQQAEYEQAAISYRQAIARLQVASESSSLDSAQRSLGYTHLGYGMVLRRLGKYSESLAELNKASSLASSEQATVNIGIVKNITVSASGDDEAATRHVEALLAKASDAEHWYDAARVYAIAAASITDDDNSTQDRLVQADGYATRAVQLLVQAGERDYFRQPRNVELLQTELDFQSLKKNDAFLAFIKQLKMKGNGN